MFSKSFVCLLVLFSIFNHFDSTLGIPTHFEDGNEWNRQDVIKFTEPTYKAVINENGEITVLNGPITLQNPYSESGITVFLGNYEDYALSLDEIETGGISVNLSLNSAEPIQRGIDIVFIDAVDTNFDVVAKCVVLVFSFKTDLNPYKLKFNVGDTEYIVLNYFYFKWFLVLLTLSGLMILIVEMYELIKNIKIMRSTKSYKELQNV
ncbi:uncharacterized protein LOC115878996 [Sitophilus oryzae]|uniref:Uncharacterized protein LOC115878996 n=1 Tax=Sitophilus oryzae TaxID=7048 RepID=A0A6J2XJK8_SITOR|nr:uncharacterized protein LOC115878996 [Sitophilus oryzae]